MSNMLFLTSVHRNPISNETGMCDAAGHHRINSFGVFHFSSAAERFTRQTCEMLENVAEAGWKGSISNYTLIIITL